MKVVVALGGNALGNSPSEQIELVKHTGRSVADLIEDGHEVTLVHGNGPQVGMIQSAFETASKTNEKVPLMPLPECGAMSQGYIGFHLQNAIRNELDNRKIERDIATIVTQTVVDKEDPGFKHPSKPIGAFYPDEESIKEDQAKTGLEYVEDSGRGYRFVVASPKPIDFLEASSIETLVDRGTVVIASGGGGIPVIKTEEGYKGVPAVIDKDSSSARLAEIIDADMFIILTAVSRVMINFNKPGQKEIVSMNVEEANAYIKKGQFAKGSMLPKVEAAIDFVTRKPDSKAVIAELKDASEAIKGIAGTTITR
ncbi:MAG: carbamate kinase [Bacillota bacterium]